jgi:hypothetical protein
MKLYEFLLLVLKNQADFYHDLEATYGPDITVSILERASEKAEAAPDTYDTQMGNGFWTLDPNSKLDQTDAYTELQDTIEKMKMPKAIEFYLWSYPYYRTFIESGLPLQGQFKMSKESDVHSLYEEAISKSRFFFESVGFQGEYLKRAEVTLDSSLKKFKVSLLKTAGISHLRLT